MFFSARSPETQSSTMPFSTSRALRPGDSTATQACSAPFTSAFTTCSRVTPWPRMKPCNGLVGLPSASKETAHFGPFRRFVASGSRAATPSTIATMRLGVPSTRISPCARREAASPFVRVLFTASTVGPTTCGGSSSRPISRAKVRGRSVAGSSMASSGVPVFLSVSLRSGNPSSPRRSTHSAAVSRIRRRMVLNAWARSVVEIAPRASSTLKA